MLRMFGPSAPSMFGTEDGSGRDHDVSRFEPFAARFDLVGRKISAPRDDGDPMRFQKRADPRELPDNLRIAMIYAVVERTGFSALMPNLAKCRIS